MKLDELFQASRARCLENPLFIPAFYSRLFEIAPELISHFAHADMLKLQDLLATALHEIDDIENFDSSRFEYWLSLSRRHHELEVRSEHYDVWLGCFLEIVDEFDPQFDEQIEQAWCVKLEQIAAFIKLVY